MTGQDAAAVFDDENALRARIRQLEAELGALAKRLDSISNT